jgi:glycosyltransferase involved in cell wall biosynthesis
VSIGYIPYAPAAVSTEAGWLAKELPSRVETGAFRYSLNLSDHEYLPEASRLRSDLEALCAHPWIVAEGIGGFLWAAVARANGFRGGFTLLPYLNPTSWFDLTAIAVYRRYADSRDRVFVGSTPSARIYRGLGINATVGEPFGIDCDVFRPRDDAPYVRALLGIDVIGPLLLFAGRVEPDKDLHRLLSVALKARLLFPDLQVVIATHVVDQEYFALLSRLFAGQSGLHLVVDPSREQLASLYSTANAFVTASTSHFETFGRAPAEALACGTMAIAPRYDGFAEILAQAGGSLVDVQIEKGLPRVSEVSLLRAIYEALSFPLRASAEEISSVARQRFCRSRTLRILSYLTDASTEIPNRNDEIPELDLEIPHEWRNSARRMDAMNAGDALSHLWNWREHRELSEFNEPFRAAIRNILARAAFELSSTVVAPCL